MNSDLQHPMDELLERELHALRTPVESKHGVGDAVRAMQAPPAPRPWQRFKWPLGIGSAAAVVIAVILLGSLSTTNAFAGELRGVALAQASQKTKHQKSYLYGESKQLLMVMEFWTDHDKEAYRQFTGDGKLEIARVSDGKRTYHYVAENPAAGSASSAQVEDDHSPHFDTETLNSILESPSFKNYRIEKKSGVTLNGQACDYYSIANGYYRLWVDPVTKLPLQREIYDKGVTLWKRCVYDYPASFAASTFQPLHVEGMTYVEAGSARR